MVGSRIAHYLVESRLGEGGMGEVFLARDLALDRTAAIKVLPPAFDAGLRERLLREANAARRLQHPGIATFYESAETDGVAFIAMEYVHGETLRDRLRHGALPVEDALGIVSGLLEALGHAHVAGVLHRDIKPENVMLTGPATAKLLDFGLARDLRAGASAEDAVTVQRTLLTEAGTLLGTLGYMSPEQLTGQPVGPASDLFAVGAVLYEMLSGRMAFPGGTPAARIGATLAGRPPALGDVSPGVQAVVDKSLATDPGQRYQSAPEFLRDLRRVEEGQAVAAFPESVAVFDFVNRSGDPGDSWIGSGIAESLISDLSRRSGVALVPRPKVLKVQAAGESEPATWGHLLGCRWVLTGSFQRMGSALRVLVQLTHVPTERVVADEKFDGQVEDVFVLQDRIAEHAATVLELEENPDSAPRVDDPGAAAYERYAKGREFWLKMSKGGFDRAQELFEEAVAMKPDYAEALIGLAMVHDMRFTFTTDREELRQAAGYARRALQIALDDPDALSWLGYSLWRQGESEEALAVFQRAHESDPGHMYPPYFLACLLMALDRPGESLPYYQKAVRSSPGFGFAWVGLGNAHMECGRYSEAMWSLDKGVELETRAFHATAGADGYAGECLRRQGDLEGARRRCLRGLEAVERSDHMYRDSFRAMCLSTLGRCALEQGDGEAARAAYRQGRLHLEGRTRTLAAGPLMTQVLAGEAAAEGDRSRLDRARELFAKRQAWDWSWLWGCDEATTRGDLERAERHLA